MNWCKDFYDDFFAEQHLVRRDKENLDKTIAFFEDKLHLKPGDKIFDQCCGIGSLSIPLAKKGYNIIGMDLIPSYISRVQHDADEADVDGLFEVGDAHEYITAEECDAAINWWTSFGYTPDDAHNIKMLECVYKSLKPKAWFILDYMNTPQRLEELKNKEYTISEIKDGDCKIIWKTHLDDANEMIIKKWSYIGHDGEEIEKQGGGAKAYTKEHLQEMFEACGFNNIDFYGSVIGEDLVNTSKRCIVVAQKK